MSSPGGRSLQSVLMSTFLICLAVILSFVVLSVVPRVSQMLTTSAIERTKETVLQGVSGVDIYVNNALTALHYASGLLPEEPLSDASGWQQRLDFMRNSRAETAALAFFSQEGELFYATDGSLRVPPSQVRGAAWFQDALSWEGTATHFSLPHVENLFSAQRRYVISLSRGVPYLEGGQERMGVLLMDIDYLSFSQVANRITLGESGYVYLMDEEGALVMHPRLQQIYKGLYEEDRRSVLEATLGIVSDRSLGRERTLIVTSVNQTRWRLVGVAYADEILRLQSAFLRIISVVLAAAVLLSLAAASVMAYAITRPIRYLEQRMRLVEAGDLHVSIDERGFREIRSVSSAFNHMLWRIRQLMDQIVVEQETKRLHELNALQAQINPHFLYNTLDSIIWMQERGRSQQAVIMVSALARLFRISISKGRSEILVQEELEHVRNYLIIQQMRFKDRFLYTIQSAEDVRNLHTLKLIVQPLVENAINHAMDELGLQQLHIEVAAFREGGRLCFTVRDDGLGIPQDKLKGLLSAPAGAGGIGLRNVHERIQLTYGKAYGLQIDSVEDEGTCVKVLLPLLGEAS
ncbi:MAG: sensor histidine kinase [Christensenellales bacterium]